MVPHATPSQTYQQHSAWGTDTAPRAVWGAGMIGTRAVTGKEAGTRDVDKLMGAEYLLGATAASSAVPEASLLADTAEVRREVRGRPKAGLTSGCLVPPGKVSGTQSVQAPSVDSGGLSVSPQHSSYEHRKWGCPQHQPHVAWA